MESDSPHRRRRLNAQKRPFLHDRDTPSETVQNHPCRTPTGGRRLSPIRPTVMPMTRYGYAQVSSRKQDVRGHRLRCTLTVMASWAVEHLERPGISVTDPIRHVVAGQVGELLWAVPEAGRDANSGTETSGRPARSGLLTRVGISPGQRGGGCEIRTREGVNPTRFPSLPTVGPTVSRSNREAAITCAATDDETC